MYKFVLETLLKLLIINISYIFKKEKNMIDEKIIEIINNLKNKRLTDVEITDILLENNYKIDEIKENLHEYNRKHGLVDEDYLEEYYKLQENVKKMKYFEKKKMAKNKTKSIKKTKKTNKIFYVILIILILAILIMGYLYLEQTEFDFDFLKNKEVVDNNIINLNQDLNVDNNTNQENENPPLVDENAFIPDENIYLPDDSNSEEENDIEALTNQEFLIELSSYQNLLRTKEFFNINISEEYIILGDVYFEDENIFDLNLVIMYISDNNLEKQEFHNLSLNKVEKYNEIVLKSFKDYNFLEDQELFNTLEYQEVPDSQKYRYYLLKMILQEANLREIYSSELLKLSSVILNTDYKFSNINLEYAIEENIENKNIFIMNFLNDLEIIQTTITDFNTNEKNLIIQNFNEIIN